MKKSKIKPSKIIDTANKVSGVLGSLDDLLQSNEIPGTKDLSKKAINIIAICKYIMAFLILMATLVIS